MPSQKKKRSNKHSFPKTQPILLHTPDLLPYRGTKSVPLGNRVGIVMQECRSSTKLNYVAPKIKHGLSF